MRRPGPFTLRTTTLLLALALGTGCSDPSPAPPTAPPVAKTSTTGDITVTATDPTSAPQDTTLDIRVSGSNFDRYSSVSLGIGGVASPKIRTNATRYVSSSQLVANITIAADADVASYDVMVTSPIRKPGIGTEIFQVRQTGQIVNPTATFTYYDVSATGPDGGTLVGDGLTATGLVASNGESIYDDGRCNVTSAIFANAAGDATMDPVGSGGRVRNCDGRSARALTLRFGRPLYLAPGATAASDATGGHYSNVREVLALALKGDTGERRFRLMLRGGSACDYLRFEARTLGGITGRPIRVTRIASRAGGDAEDAWEAVPQPVDGRYVAFCEKGGTADSPVLVGVYDVNFRIRVLRK